MFLEVRANWAHSVLHVAFFCSRYLRAVWLEIIGQVFLRFSEKLDPQDPSRSTGLVMQLKLHEKSAPQTNSKVIA